MVALTPAADAWSGAEHGIKFKVRPLQGGIEGQTLSENAKYQLLVKFPADPGDSHVRVGGLSLLMWREGNLLVGQLVVGHTFGAVVIEVWRGGQRVAGATIDVQPRHLDVEGDFSLIKLDLDRISFSLAYAIWRRAHQQAFPDFKVPQGTPEWLALLRNSWARINRALREISRDPNTELLHIYEVRPAARVGHLDERGLRWLAQQSGAWTSSDEPFPVASVLVDGRFITPERALTSRREVTLDTPANRALKYALNRLEMRLRRVLQAIEDLPAKHFAVGDKTEYVSQLRQILRDSQHYTAHGFLSSVEARSATSPQHLHVLRADPRYRQVFRSLGVLQWGVLVNIAGPITEMSLKDTWELYEYWVYLFVLGLFVKWGWDCVAQGVLSVSQPGAPILLDLARGERSQTQFEHVDTESGRYSLATITFHREFPSRRANPGLGRGALTVTRNVDILVEIESAGEVRRAVIDPKYQAEEVDGCLTCPSGAVDDMHVYRDAVGRWEMGALGKRHFVRSLDAAVAVFPSRHEECASASLFFNSLSDGIGALPLLPPSDQEPKLLPEFLAEFLS
jgi:hypothetical protein